MGGLAGLGLRLQESFRVLRSGESYAGHGREIYGLMHDLSDRNLSAAQIGEVQIETVMRLVHASGGVHYIYDKGCGQLTQTAHLGQWRSFSYSDPNVPVGEKNYFLKGCLEGLPAAGGPESWFRDEHDDPFALWIYNRGDHARSKRGFAEDAGAQIYGADPRFVKDILFLLINNSEKSADFAMLANWTENASKGRFRPIVTRTSRDQVQETLVTFRNACNLARKEAQEREALAQMLFEMGEMAVREVHDIKNGLSSIGGFARALLRDVPDVIKDPTDEVRNQRVLVANQVITDEIGKTETAAKTVIDRLKSGDISFTLQLDRVDLAEMIGGFEGMFTANFRRRNIDCEFKVDPGPIFVGLNKDAFIKRVLNELMMNVIKYGGEKLEITLGLSDDGNNAVLMVRDHGIGIAGADLPRVFERGERLTETAQAQSTGMGLFIAKKLVEKMGGNMWVESEGLGQGTAFYISLPLVDTPAEQ